VHSPTPRMAEEDSEPQEARNGPSEPTEAKKGSDEQAAELWAEQTAEFGVVTNSVPTIPPPGSEPSEFDRFHGCRRDRDQGSAQRYSHPGRTATERIDCQRAVRPTPRR
jgi:hypothetical protein